MSMEVDKIIEIINDMKKENPYPEDIFVSMKGKAARNSWNVCCEDIIARILEEQKMRRRRKRNDRKKEFENNFGYIKEDLGRIVEMARRDFSFIK
ncbi:MAG: hypothetical protein GPJ52_01990 [Candidatus Heimdallarchaeota archaeon]|nr:hypothetical protein [Candidatus Heimdallarchaeota archaeon]